MSKGLVSIKSIKESPVKPKRKDLKPGEVLCDYCPAKCCHYFALPMDTPDEAQDYDYLRWFLLHEHATVFTEGEDWYLLVHTTCKHLQDDYRCGIYETRPQICREYSTDNCEYDEDATYDQYFETAEQIHEYAEAVLPPRRRKGIRSPKPALLPVVV